MILFLAWEFWELADTKGLLLVLTFQRLSNLHLSLIVIMIFSFKVTFYRFLLLVEYYIFGKTLLLIELDLW